MIGREWKSIYWGSYMQIEKRLIDLSHSIYFDDKQLDVYSNELSDILLSVCSKIESVSKDIFQEHFIPFLLDQDVNPKNRENQKEFNIKTFDRKR